jgi:hypothetical protein
MNPLIKIADVKYMREHILEITFDDGCIKQFDFAELLEFKGLEQALQDVTYFRQVHLSLDQRRISWNNGYDCCADWLRYFAKDIDNEWTGVAETVALPQRMQIAKQHRLQCA